ncbi:MAG: DUF4272 domain-containing protein [Iodobacter sp.]
MPRILVILIAAITLLACSLATHGDPTVNERNEKIKSMETKASPEALQRKERSERVLRAEAVPINKFLPVIETERGARHRTKDKVAYRALALLVVAVKGEGLEQPSVEKIVKDYGLDPHFTPKERAFVKNVSPSQHDKVQFVWRYEAAWTLLWALGYVEKLEKPVAICDVLRAVKFMQERKTKQFIADAKLRALPEILDQADRIYRYHWAAVDARVNGKKTPAGLEPGITLERHYALNWLVGYMDQEWDDISTDT